MEEIETVKYNTKDVLLPLKCYPYGIIHSLTIYDDHIEIMKSDPNTVLFSQRKETVKKLMSYASTIAVALEDKNPQQALQTAHELEDLLTKLSGE